MKTIIAGSRTIKDYNVILRAIKESGFEISEIVSGKAQGVDTLGEQYAKENKIPIKPFPAGWKDLSHPDAVIKSNGYGKYNAIAGHLRNQQMAEYADALIVVIKNKSSGSMDMLNRMKKMNKKVFVKYVGLVKKEKVINSFSGENRWLSNFWPCFIKLDGLIYNSVESAYVASKTLDKEERLKISELETPGKAKRYGRKMKLRDDWDDVKVSHMLSFLQQKFKNGTELGDKLIETDDKILIEENTWNDTFWGICKGVGQNNLGKLLMKVRDDIK